MVEGILNTKDGSVFRGFFLFLSHFDLLDSLVSMIVRSIETIKYLVFISWIVSFIFNSKYLFPQESLYIFSEKTMQKAECGNFFFGKLFTLLPSIYTHWLKQKKSLDLYCKSRNSTRFLTVYFDIFLEQIIFMFSNISPIYNCCCSWEYSSYIHGRYIFILCPIVESLKFINHNIVIIQFMVGYSLCFIVWMELVVWW